MPQMESLPIYVHDGVVFPGCTERLRVQDAVSMAMVRSCMAEGKGFGCVPLKFGKGDKVPIYSIGSEVEVLAIQEGGGKEIEVTVLGKRRFRIIEAISMGGHPGARVLWIEDSDIPSAKDEIAILRRDLVSLYEKFSLRFPGRLVPLNEESLSSASDEEFSFIIAGHVSFNRDEKHSLLEMTSTRDRLRKEVECMKSMPPIQGRLI